ncbi:28S ribosomal protein S18b, mitochondrial, partial [Trichinella nelsoni]
LYNSMFFSLFTRQYNRSTLILPMHLQTSRRMLLPSRLLCSESTPVEEIDNDQGRMASVNLEELGTNDVEKRKRKLRPIHPWPVSVKYMESETYKQTYGNNLIWVLYRRNMKGPMHMLSRTRPNCVDGDGRFRTNYPCPICRDEYLVIDYRNIKLLQQFIIPQTGQLVESRKSGLCGHQYLKLRVEIAKATDCGYIPFTVPFRNYDYSEYYSWWPKGDNDHFVEEEPEFPAIEQQSPKLVYPTHNPDVFPNMIRRRRNPFKQNPYRSGDRRR